MLKEVVSEAVVRFRRRIPETKVYVRDSHKGMSIGLSVCKTIITAYGGRMIAVNHDDGAEFVFTLPIGERYNYES